MNVMRRRSIGFLLLVTPLLGIAAALVWSENIGSVAGDRSEPPAALYDGEMEFELPSTPVEVTQLTKQPLVHSISASGRIRTLLETKITSRIPGVVVDLRVREGGFVRRDSVILKIEEESFQIAWLKAQDRLNGALSQYALETLLVGQTLLDRIDLATNTRIDTANRNDMEAAAWLTQSPRKEMIASTTGLNQARLDLRIAELDLQHTVIRAPFDGFVTGLAIFQGGMIDPGVELMSLVSLDSLVLEVGILETEFRLVRTGTQVGIELAAFPGEKFTGIVRTISPVLYEESGTCDIRIEIANPGRRIRPGMFANATISNRIFSDRLLVPRDAILIRDEREVVFVHEAGIAQWRYVKTGLENDEFIEITDGLGEDEELIVSGHFSLAHEAKVVVVEP